MICALAVFLSFTIHSPIPFEDYSISYQNKWLRLNVAPKISECQLLGRMMDMNEETFQDYYSQDERLWVIATAIVESGLDNKVVSKAKAKSSMQTYRKYSPKELRKSDLRRSGIYHAIRYYRNEDLCSAAAKYNAGPNGSCPSVYAKHVLLAYNSLKGLNTWKIYSGNLTIIKLLQEQLLSITRTMNFLTLC